MPIIFTSLFLTDCSKLNNIVGINIMNAFVVVVDASSETLTGRQYHESTN